MDLSLMMDIEHFVDTVMETYGEAMDGDITEAIANEVLKQLDERNGNL